MFKVLAGLLVVAGVSFGVAHAANPPAATPAPAAKPATPTAPAAAKPAMAEKTCGQMMADKAVLPAKMAEVMTAVVQMMDAHAAYMATMKGNKEAKAEENGMKKLSKVHKDLATQFTKAANEMKNAEKWPAAQHDHAAMMADPKIQESMKAMLKSHKEMAALLNAEVAMMEQMAKGTN